MKTSWPKRLPGPGMSAERVGDRIRTLSLCRSGSRRRARRLDRGIRRAGEWDKIGTLIEQRLIMTKGNL